ncbi:hypothetical protein Salat_1700900 [Sesamum alatum]|uniref:Uncharacterized protein n=1 Tax=Sesamum alatum TaxID=300844 RepID=A0AAE2CK33_9LAMI|nr:hypothetical protein Salat_1700900 [Sesamum alatum]
MQANSITPPHLQDISDRRTQPINACDTTKKKHYVDCNDEGAEFSIAEVDCQLHQLIGPEVKTEQLNHLLPLEIGEADELTDPMLAVQINKFQCGGLAIGVCSSRRIFDSCSQAIFLKAWSNVAIDGGLDICPDFDSPRTSPLRIGPASIWGVENQRHQYSHQEVCVRQERNIYAARKVEPGMEKRTPTVQGGGRVCSTNTSYSARR